MVEGEDVNKAERHQKDAEGIVIFTGLFSAALAALITVTIQDLRPGPQDTLPFSPPIYAIWVNSLWISSLVISITSALLATLIQQWTRRYIRITQPLGCAHKRARVRQHVTNGVTNLHFLLATDGVPTLLHLSVFLFFAGLLILLRHLNHTVFNAVVGWVLLCVVIYTHITILPIYQPANPHYAPLSSMVWHLYADILYPGFKFLRGTRIPGLNVPPPPDRLFKRLEEKADDIVLKKSPELDANILETLLVTMGEDDSREKFFEAIPGFFDSQVVDMPKVKQKLPPIFSTNFRRTVDQFLGQTLLSDSVSEIARCRRLLTCLNATHRVLGDRACKSITNTIIHSEIWIEMPPSPEIGHILRRWRKLNSSNAHIGSSIIARIIYSVEKRDDTWMALARSHLGVSKKVLKGYLKNGDSVLLANLIKTTRLFLEEDMQFQGILQSITDFNVQDTSFELQQDFCTLWNEIVSKSKDSVDFGNCTFVLDEICRVHDALHPTPTSPATVPEHPTSITSNNDSLLLGPSYTLCAGPQLNHHPTNASRQSTTIAASRSSSPGVQLPSPPLQRDEKNVIPHIVLSRLPEFPVEFRTHVPPGLGHSYSTTTSHTLATPRDISVSDPDVIVVAGERDFQDLNAHSPHQPDSDPHAPGNSMGTSRRGKSSI